MYANPYQQTEWSAVDAADPLELVILLYEKTLVSLSQARRCLEERDIAGRVRALQTACDCVMELVRSLDHHGQPEMTRRLLELYVFALDRMQAANFEQKVGPLNEAWTVLSTLAQAWRECRLKLQTEQAFTAAEAHQVLAG